MKPRTKKPPLDLSKKKADRAIFDGKCTPEPTHHKCIPVRKAEGKVVWYAYDADSKWDRYYIGAENKKMSGCSVPGDDKLFNFSLIVGSLGKLTILDHYGDEDLPDEIRRKILGVKYGDMTIGIFEKTGRIVRIGFIEEKVSGFAGPETRLSFCFYGFETEQYLPKKWRSKIHELRSMKRPFNLTHRAAHLYLFMTRWASYSELQKELVVELHFQKAAVQVWGDSYRELTNWGAV